MLLLISDANILMDYIEELLNYKLLKQVQARNSFDSMKAKGSRLPWGDVEKLLNKWELIEN